MTDREEFLNSYNRSDTTALTGDQMPYGIKSFTKRSDGNFDCVIQAPMDTFTETRVWDVANGTWL